MEQRVSVVNQSEVQLRALQREAEASRTLYETFLTRFKETREQTDFQRPDARIISRADTPGAPSAPKKRLLFFIAIFLSASVGIALVVLLEALDRGFRSMDQIEDQTGVVALGLVPSIRGMTKLGKAPHDLIVEHTRVACQHIVVEYRPPAENGNGHVFTAQRRQNVDFTVIGASCRAHRNEQGSPAGLRSAPAADSRIAGDAAGAGPDPGADE